jgi:protein-disulfide isomerase
MPPTPKKSSPAVPKTGSPRNRNLIIALAAATAILVALVVGALVLSGGDSSGPTDASASSFLDGIPQEGVVLGEEAAEVTLIQFEDPQCPVCKQFQDEGFADIVSEYVKPGKITIRYAGLAFLGDDSQKALLHVLAAGRQNKAFQFSEELYARQGGENTGWVTDDLLADIAADLGLDHDQLMKDAGGTEVSQEAAAMAAEATTLGVQGTPWFFVQIGDAAPYEVQPTSFGIESFRPILDDALEG